MDKETIKAKLQEYAEELKPAGIVHVWLHGSYVRGTAITGESDVDLVALFDRAKCPSMLDRISLKNKLTDILGIEADLSDAEFLKEEVGKNFDREAELVF